MQRNRTKKAELEASRVEKGDFLQRGFHLNSGHEGEKQPCFSTVSAESGGTAGGFGCFVSFSTERGFT